MAEGSIVNKVAESGLITIDLEEYLPGEEILAFDLKDYLFRELILKEKDFRDAMKSHDWSRYKDKHVAVFCSADAVIPRWAGMLIASYLEPVTKSFVFGNKDHLTAVLLKNALNEISFEQYRDQRVIIKGCGDEGVPQDAYMEITRSGGHNLWQSLS